ncbi:MAG: glycosyltransferase family 87 protein [Anaerolineales bacterium]|jgi:hypothetical protein
MKQKRLRTRMRWLVYFIVACVLIVFTGINGGWAFRNNRELRDFGSFVAAGQAAAKGQNPYQENSSLVYSVFFPNTGKSVLSPNLNPPVSVLFFQPLAALDPVKVLLIWRLLSLFGFGLAILLLWRPAGRTTLALQVVWSFSLAGLWSVLELGQIYVFLLLIVVGAWRLLRGGWQVPAGILIGLLFAIKPNFAVWAVALFLSGYYPVALSAFVSAGLISLIPLLIYGPIIYQEWFRAITSFNGLSNASNASLMGFFERVGVAWLGPVVVVILLLVFAVWVWRARPAIMKTSAIALLVSLLAAPIAWVGYTLILLPIFLEYRWNRPLWISAALLTIPAPLVLFTAEFGLVNRLVVGSLYGLALWLALYAILIRRNELGDELLVPLFLEHQDGKSGSPNNLPSD